MKPWLGTPEFLTDSAEQALVEQRGRAILAQQAGRAAAKAAKPKGRRNAQDTERRKAA